MKINSRNEDILMYDVSNETIDHAEKMGSVIVHFTKTDKPVLLEIPDASKFLTQTVEAKKRAAHASKSKALSALKDRTTGFSRLGMSTSH